MATYTSTACQTFLTSGFFTSPPKYLEEGVVAKSVQFVYGTASGGLSASSGDVIQMCNVPKGCNILDVQLDVQGMATGSNVAFNVGDGNSTNRYIASASVAAAIAGGAIFRMNNAQGGGYSYSVDDTIDVVVGTIGSMSGQAILRLVVTYAMDQSTDGNS